MRSPGGFTLVEMLVVMILMAVLFGIAAFGVTRTGYPESGVVEQGRREAILGGKPVSIQIARPDRAPDVLRFLPDGRVIGEKTTLWSGVPRVP